MKRKSDQANKEKGKGDRPASAAIGCPARCVHFTAHNGHNPNEEREYVIPDENSMDRPTSSYYTPPSTRTKFEGIAPNYVRVSSISYCIARNVAIDLAEGIGLLAPDHFEGG